MAFQAGYLLSALRMMDAERLRIGSQTEGPTVVEGYATRRTAPQPTVRVLVMPVKVAWETAAVKPHRKLSAVPVAEVA